MNNQRENNKFNKIIIPTRPHVDSILGIFLLKNFGKETYNGIENASLEILQELPKGETPESLEEKGVLVLDLGKGKFDHHNKNKTLSQLIAEDLGIDEDPALRKLLLYCERDDKFGLGTISSDPIDRAFGLSGIVTSLNKNFSTDPEKIVTIVSVLIGANFLEEKKRTEILPQEFEKKLNNKEAEIFDLKQNKKKLKIVMIESDDLSIAGWLRAKEGLNADVICQKMSSGYVNILSKQSKRVNLSLLAAYLRNEEAALKGKKINALISDLMRPGKIIDVPEWYYDRATNSILNGGSNPKGISPTAIPFNRIKEIIKESLIQGFK